MTGKSPRSAPHAGVNADACSGSDPYRISNSRLELRVGLCSGAFQGPEQMKSSHPALGLACPRTLRQSFASVLLRIVPPSLLPGLRECCLVLAAGAVHRLALRALASLLPMPARSHGER